MNQFEALGLGSAIVKAIADLGFEQPTPIQEKTIPHLLTGNTDLVALAQTGTGKTAAFGLPLLSLIDPSSKKPQGLILCPTRELCVQITNDLKQYSRYMPGVRIVSVYGGAAIVKQINDLRDGAQIIVATPGRMVDIIERKRVDLSNIQFAVLDEADEMLNMGFKEDLDNILSMTPSEKTTWLFSATMPNEVARISKKYMNNPVELTAGRKNEGNENIEHLYYVTHARDKYPTLKRIADYNPDIFAIVFCRTKIETQQVADSLIKDGYNADALHGDLSQAQRDHVMKRFRGRSLQMLVATDVAARGIDVSDVTHVINYNLPDELESYTHRSGRTARAGKKGVSISLVHMKETSKIKTLEHLLKKKFERLTIPTGMAVCEKQLIHLVKQVHSVQVNPEIGKFLPSIYEELKDLDREEIIQRFVSIEFNRFLEYYQNAPDLNVSTSAGSERNTGKRNPRLFFSLGELDGFDNQSLKRFIAETVGTGVHNITWTDIKNSYSFVEVREEVVPMIQAAFSNESFKGRPVKVEVSGNREDDRGGRGRERKFRKAPVRKKSWR